MANSIDTDQTPHFEESDLGPHCLRRPVCPNSYGYYGNYIMFNKDRLDKQNNVIRCVFYDQA